MVSSRTEAQATIVPTPVDTVDAFGSGGKGQVKRGPCTGGPAQADVVQPGDQGWYAGSSAAWSLSVPQQGVCPLRSTELDVHGLVTGGTSSHSECEAGRLSLAKGTKSSLRQIVQDRRGARLRSWAGR